MSYLKWAAVVFALFGIFIIATITFLIVLYSTKDETPVKPDRLKEFDALFALFFET